MLGEPHEGVAGDADPVFLLITRSPRPGTDGVEWMTRHRDEVRAALPRHGAILLRGFTVEGAPAFTALARNVSPVLHTEYGDLAPEDPGAGVYAATVYPEQHAIHFHNEGAHTAAAPLYLFFLNESAPQEGGATRLVNTRRVLAEIDPTLRRRLREVGLTYVRTHHSRVDTSWQALYGTADPRVAEQRCREAGVAFRWPRRDTLQTSVTLPALTTHPVTGEEVLFHQLFLFHRACLNADTRAGLDAIYAPDELPRSVRWASGEPIDDATVRDLFALYEKHTVDVGWQPGDALIVDNALVAHGRAPFAGRRKLLVAMGGVVQNQPRRPTARAPRREGPDPGAPLPRADHDPVPVRFRAVASRAPEATALACEEQTWTYRDLEVRALRTAATLRALGLPRGAAVGVTGPPSFEVVAALLGVWMNGQVVVPIDADLPATRKDMMLVEAAAAALLFAGEEPTWFAGGPKIDLAAPLVVPEPDFQPVALRSDDPAYVFFTSGSTGRPKGITGTHVGVAHFLDWQRTTFRIVPGDRIAQLTRLSFDVVLRDLFLALTSGATVCLPPASLNLADPWAWFRRARITRLHAVPSLASVWLAGSVDATCDTLTTVFFAGEPLADALVRRMRAATSAEIVNLYGPTETTLAKCAFRVGEKVEKGVQPIGYPLPGVMVLILNEQGGRCEDGETGEIVIRTPYRTLGYLRIEDGAGSRFGPNPFGTATDDIVYYTGDLGRVRPDGALDILGRKDDQLKVMGVRIEPQEVSAVLLSHPQVRQAFVTAYPGPVPSLVAYVVADEKLAPAGVLRAFLSEHLPAALVPQRFLHLPVLPLNASGKIDRQALPQPGAASGVVAPPPALSDSGTEARLAAIFQDLLRLQAVDPSDDFFECGGHSLLAMQLVSRVRDSFGVDLEIQHVFECSTLAALSRCIGELSPMATKQGSEIAVCPIDRGSPQPLSFAQQRLWFFAKLVPEQGVYNIPGALRFRGGVDFGLLQGCIDALVARHPSLRTRFIESDGAPQQRIDPMARWIVDWRDVSALPPGRRAAAVREMARALARQPFRLDSAPLARAALIRESETDDVFVYVLDHGIADGWSNFVFSRELVQLYAAALAGADASLPALPVDTLDFALDERRRFADCGRRELDFWTAHLRGAPGRLDLPTDRPRPPVQTFNGAGVVRTLPAALGRALNQASGDLNSTLFMKLFAGFNVLLHELSGARDFVVGIPVARRTRRELESVIGCFINTLALRTRILEGATFATVLAATRASVLGGFAHQDAPFERVVEALAPLRDPGRSPIFQVLFNYLHLDEPGTVSEGLAVEREVLVDPEAKFDMTLYVRERRERIEVRLVYNADLFDADRMERLLGRYESVLEACLRQPRRPLCEWLQRGSGDLSPRPPSLEGKGERSDSPFPSRDGGEGDRSASPVPAAPQTLMAMLGIWGEVLKLDRVDAGHDFFALGGHSLLAAQLAARVGDRFGLTVPLRTVFAHPTAAALAAWVDGVVAEGQVPVLPPIVPAPRATRDLSLDQERLWQLHRAGVDGHYYNVPRAVRLSGRLDLDTLHRALRAVVRHHEALRTIFADEADGPRTRVCEDQDIELEVLDGADATAAIHREARHRFDLGNRLPVRAAVVRHDDDEHTLIVTAHHIAADCWSLGLPFQAIVTRDEPWYPGIFFADLMTVYQAFSGRRPFPLAPPPISFGDFASWQKARLHSGDFAQHAAFWRDHLADAPRTIDLPTDFPRPAHHTQAGARHEFPFPAPLAGQLDRLRREHRTTLFVPLLTAFGLAMKAWSGHDDLVVGTPVANRAQPQTRNLVGPLGNTVALRLRLGDRPTPTALIGRLRESVPRAFAHQEYPFAQLVRDLGAASAPSPLFQVRFVLQQAPDELPNLPHLAMAPVRIDRGVSKYDLSLIVAAQGPRLRAWCEFNTDLFRSATIEAFAQSYVGTLRAMVDARDHAG